MWASNQWFLVLGQEVDRPGESATSNLQSSQVILSNAGVIPLDDNSQIVICYFPK
jgi:hypothetical protein